MATKRYVLDVLQPTRAQKFRPGSTRYDWVTVYPGQYDVIRTPSVVYIIDTDHRVTGVETVTDPRCVIRTTAYGDVWIRVYDQKDKLSDRVSMHA